MNKDRDKAQKEPWMEIKLKKVISLNTLKNTISILMKKIDPN